MSVLRGPEWETEMISPRNPVLTFRSNLVDPPSGPVVIQHSLIQPSHLIAVTAIVPDTSNNDDGECKQLNSIDVSLHVYFNVTIAHHSSSCLGPWATASNLRLP